MNLVKTVIRIIDGSTIIKLRLKLNKNDFLLLHQIGVEVEDKRNISRIDSRMVNVAGCNCISEPESLNASSWIQFDIGTKAFEHVLEDDGTEFWLSRNESIIETRGESYSTAILENLVRDLGLFFSEYYSYTRNYTGACWQEEVTIEIKQLERFLR